MIISAQLLNAILQSLLLLPFIFLARRHWNKADRRVLAIFFVLFLLWQVLSTGLSGVRLFEGQQWNWTGKMAGLLLAAFIIYRSKLLGKDEIGWRARFIPGSAAAVSILLISVLAIRAGVYFLFQTPVLSFDKETLLFQGTLSAISDEIFFRGILLALLNRIFTAREDLGGFHLSWGILISSLLFGLTQGLLLHEGLHLQINLLRILLAFIAALVAGMLKERSGSLVPAILFHALWILISNH